MLVEIEEKLKEFGSPLKRVSSGRSGMTETLTEELNDSRFFEDVVYLEGRFTVKQSRDQYLGLWWSVNDIRTQIGDDGFTKFMNYVEKRITGCAYIETTYLTRAWTARRKA